MKISGFLYLKDLKPIHIGLTETMYLFRAPNCTYYTRICLPKRLKDRGFPFDLKISLLTKSRSIAVIRNFYVAPALKKLIDSVSSIANPEDFKRVVDQMVDEIREKFEINGMMEEGSYNQIPIRTQNASNKRHIGNSPEPIILADALEQFIVSKSKEQIRPLTVQQLKQRAGHFINSTQLSTVAEITSADAQICC